MPSATPHTPAAARDLGRVRGAVWAVVVALLLTIVPAGPTDAQSDPRDRLAETERKLESTIEELKELAVEAETSEAAVAAARAKADELEDALNDALEALQEQQIRVAQAEDQVAESIAEIGRIEGNLNRRARDMFKGDVPPVIRLVGSANGLEETLDGVAMLSRLAARDGADLESLDAARVAAEAAGERLRIEQAELEIVRAERERLLAQAEAALAQESELLAQVTDQQERLQAEQEQLEEESEDIEAIIAAEEAARKAAEEATARRNRASAGSSAPAPPASGNCYAWPARGAVTSNYGPRWGRMHAGIDIDGNTGDGLYAAQSGVVISAGWQGGYGRLTLIRHGDGVVTAYAHQSAFGVNVGQTVTRGQWIGKMGASGNVTGSHLHFETRVGGSAVNPRRYLC